MARLRAWPRMARWSLRLGGALALALSPPTVAAQSRSVQLWLDWLPTHPLPWKAMATYEVSVRGPVSGRTPKQLVGTATSEWRVRPWLLLTAGGTTQLSDPVTGAASLELRPQLGAGFSWRRGGWNLYNLSRLEWRHFEYNGGPRDTEEWRARLRYGAQWTRASRHYLMSDLEWFYVRRAREDWFANQLRVRTGVGFPAGEGRAVELQFMGVLRARAGGDPLEGADNVLRLRFRQRFR